MCAKKIELKRKFQEQEEKNFFLEALEVEEEFLYPDLLETHTLSRSELGTAMHKVMEFLDFKTEYTSQTIQTLLEELKQKSILSEQEAHLIPAQQLVNFSQSNLGKRLQKASHIETEKAFSMLLPSMEVYPELMNISEEILVNGIIDCYFFEENHVILVDYKSDHVQHENELKMRYQIQLQLYQKALESALNQPIFETYIYSFHLGKEIRL